VTFGKLEEKKFLGDNRDMIDGTSTIGAELNLGGVIGRGKPLEDRFSFCDSVNNIPKS
jgi:hypothetical protein